MSKRNYRTGVIESVISTYSRKMVCWLCAKYQGLREEDGEDIVQESSLKLWDRYHTAVNMKVHEIISLWKTIIRNCYTHWLRKQRFSEEWDDRRLQYDWEEKDYCWAQGNEAKLAKREAFYDYIDKLKDKDRRLMEMTLIGMGLNEISQTLGYSSVQVAKNRKGKIMRDMRNDFRESILRGILVA